MDIYWPFISADIPRKLVYLNSWWRHGHQWFKPLSEPMMVCILTTGDIHLWNCNNTKMADNLKISSTKRLPFCLGLNVLMLIWHELKAIFTCVHYFISIASQIAKFMGPTWSLPVSCRPQMDPCWPHEPCFQGYVINSRRPNTVGAFLWGSNVLLVESFQHTRWLHIFDFKDKIQIIWSNGEGSCMQLFGKSNDDFVARSRYLRQG